MLTNKQQQQKRVKPFFFLQNRSRLTPTSPQAIETGKGFGEGLGVTWRRIKNRCEKHTHTHTRKQRSHRRWGPVRRTWDGYGGRELRILQKAEHVLGTETTTTQKKWSGGRELDDGWVH